MDLTCRYTYWKGPKKGQRCTHRPRGSDYCYHHINTAEAAKARGERRVSALDDDPIFNGAGGAGAADDAAPKPRPERTSIYHWTINTNQPDEGMSDDDKKRFKSYIDRLMNNEKILDYVSDRTAPDGRNI